MDTVSPTVPLGSAWEPIPDSEWTPAAARHLLRRAAFAARREAVEQALTEKPAAFAEKLFAARPPMEMPRRISELEENTPEFARQLRQAGEPERRKLRQVAREKARAAYDEFAIRWLQRAADPADSANEKLVLFLQDIFVVGAEKVKNPLLLFEHQALLRRQATGPYPELCRAVSRSPAMIEYLDLQQSKAGHPNENFARELFELFTLGEGNYTEADIKEAARAFTGYRRRMGQFVFLRREHDTGSKTVFGRTGPFDGDEVIDLVFQQPAAARFLPGELIRFYLSERPLPPAYLAALGDWWRKDGYHTGRLLQRFFTSRVFFDPIFRGEMIKSPVQYLLGLLQDLGLDVAPFPRVTLNALRQMGQPFYNPPNVRGWLGGQLWINSSTLAARRQLVDALFAPLEESKLNADELAELAAARSAGPVRLVLDDELAGTLAGTVSTGPDGTRALLDQLFPLGLPEAVQRNAEAQVAAVTRLSGRERALRMKQVLEVLLQAPQYHLC